MEDYSIYGSISLQYLGCFKECAATLHTETPDAALSQILEMNAVLEEKMAGLDKDIQWEIGYQSDRDLQKELRRLLNIYCEYQTAVRERSAAAGERDAQVTWKDVLDLIRDLKATFDGMEDKTSGLLLSFDSDAYRQTTMGIYYRLKSYIGATNMLGVDYWVHLDEMQKQIEG